MVLKKGTEEKGIIEGQLITHSVIDSYGDYFDKQALDKVNKDKTYFLLHMHEWSKELGTLKVYQDEKGNLKFTAKLDLSTDENGNAINKDAQKVYSMMKSGANYEMSVGGFLKQREWGKIQTDKGEVDARIIKEIDVVEGSVVLKGAVPDATVQTVKNENTNKINKVEDSMDLENLEKGMTQATEDIAKANSKIQEMENTVNKSAEEIEKMGKAIDEIMKKIGLDSSYLRKKVYCLSGGEQQKVALARMMFKEYELVLADEPTGNLDHKNKMDVIEIFKGIKREGKTIICVTHDSEVAASADRIINLTK